MKKGRILKTYKGFYYVWDQQDIFTCRLRGRLKKERPDVLTGDIVNFTITDGAEGIIESIIPRHSRLLRPSIANIDQVLLIISAKQPDVSFGILDRFLIQIAAQGLDVIICMTKMDLYDSKEMGLPLEYYQKIGYPIHYFSIHEGSEQWEELSAELEGKISVLAGPSGVGKSSLLQQLMPEEELLIGEVSQKIGRGKHTTKHAELIRWKNCLIADTPGFTSLSLRDWKLNEPKDYFPDFLELSSCCKYKGSCIHKNEPDCAVKETVEKGIIPSWRYENYLSIVKEIEDAM